MSIEPLRNTAEAADKAALANQEEAVEIASMWAQEKLEGFLKEVESNGDDHKLLKISYIISRRTSIDVFKGQKTSVGEFIKTIIKGFSEGGKVMDTIGNLASGVIEKLFGSSSGSAQTERVYEVTFDELGGLNRLDAFFFCYRFTSHGIVDIDKAIIGTCIVRSAALMIDDNAYRVVLTSSAFIVEEKRAAIAQYMVDVARHQKFSFGEDGKRIETDPEVLEGRAKLCQVIGAGIASSVQYRKRTDPAFVTEKQNTTAEKEARRQLDPAVGPTANEPKKIEEPTKVGS